MIPQIETNLSRFEDNFSFVWKIKNLKEFLQSLSDDELILKANEFPITHTAHTLMKFQVKLSFRRNDEATFEMKPSYVLTGNEGINEKFSCVIKFKGGDQINVGNGETWKRYGFGLVNLFSEMWIKVHYESIITENKFGYPLDDINGKLLEENFGMKRESSNNDKAEIPEESIGTIVDKFNDNSSPTPDESFPWSGLEYSMVELEALESDSEPEEEEESDSEGCKAPNVSACDNLRVDENEKFSAMQIKNTLSSVIEICNEKCEKEEESKENEDVSDHIHPSAIQNILQSLAKSKQQDDNVHDKNKILFDKNIKSLKDIEDSVLSAFIKQKNLSS